MSFQLNLSHGRWFRVSVQSDQCLFQYRSNKLGFCAREREPRRVTENNFDANHEVLLGAALDFAFKTAFALKIAKACLPEPGRGKKNESAALNLRFGLMMRLVLGKNNSGRRDFHVGRWFSHRLELVRR